MGIHYITGRSGSGKTMQVYREIKEALTQGGSRLILMVPEQFTLQAERDLIHTLDLPGIMDVEVLSFSRLAHKVFNEAGGLTRTHINEQGKHMILRRLLDDLRDQLTVYKTVSRQKGFVDKINNLITDLKKHDITPEQMRQKAVELENDGLISGKLLDTALIYEAFNNYLQERYIDSEDAINALINFMEEEQKKPGFLFGARIWMDGFDYFTPQTVRVIEKLALLAQDLTITFTLGMDGSSQDQDVFRVHALSMQKIRRIAKEHHIKERFSHLSTGEDQKQVSKKAPEISYLERELYQYPYKPYTHEVESIELFAGNSPESEIENLAARIISLSRERGWRYKEMAVISGAMDSYSSLIKRVFTEYDIPCFLDEKKPVIDNPIVDLVLTSLRVVDRRYRYEDVFKLLKTGFCGLSTDEVELLENYCLEFGIKGKGWQQAFELGETDYELDLLNDYRERFIQPCLVLEKGLKRSERVEGMVHALYEYLTEIKLHQQLEEWIEQLRDRGLLDQVDENAQIWNIVMKTFDQLVEILGDVKVSVSDLHRILESGFSSLEVGLIPTTLDQVLVGNIQRSKSQDVKAIFVVGCNDGILPSGLQDEGLLGADERDLLQREGLDLGGNTELLAADEKFSIYTAFSKPSDYLWISHALSDAEGRALRPSILIDRIKKLFIKIKSYSDLILSEEEEKRLIARPDSTYKYMVSHLRDCADEKASPSYLWWQVYNWYYQSGDWGQRLQDLKQGLFHQNQEAPIGYDKAAALYSLPMRASVSRLEQYVNCPFSHFIKYGLRPRERKLYTVAAPDLGELFHRSIEGFTARLNQDELDWRSLDDDQCGAILDEVMDQILPEHNNGVMLSTNRLKYLSQRLKRISKRAVWLLTDHIKRSTFNPIGHEISFGSKGTYPPIEIELPGGEHMLLEGRIDRADIYDENDDIYINVIDYKSGVEEFDLSDAYYGLRLQLLVYLQALMELEQHRIDGRVRPGGIFYFRIDDPLINTKDQIADLIQKEIRKKLKLKGLVLKDVNIVRCMDDSISGYSEVLPLGVKKDGTFYASSSVLEEEEFLSLLGHIRKLIQNIGGEILQGNIRIDPVKKGKKTACEFCPYDGICQFDSVLEDNAYRIIRKMDSQEVVRRIAEERGGYEDA